jgi:hypothetical protein
MDGIPPLLAFIGGVVAGSSVSIYLLWSRVMETSDERLTLEEAIQILESHNKLQPNLSASENARVALKSLTEDHRLNKNLKAPITYALAVLKSELVLMSIPVGLWDQFRVLANSGSTRFMLKNSLRSPVHDWILSSFSPIHAAARYNKCTLRGVALGIRFAVRLPLLSYHIMYHVCNLMQASITM